LGNHPPRFAEWNDKFRDGMRRFWAGDSGLRGEFAERMAGSADLFDRRSRKPWASINFITSHDGFTLRDLVCYNEKHNDANGEEGADGHGDNSSNNWGAEGLTEDQVILQRRARVQRALLASTVFAQGTPMLLGGDEFNRTQQGNNNAYCQDNPISWVNWADAATPPGLALTAYVGRLTAIRHAYGALQAGRFLHGGHEVAPGVPEIAWFDERGDTLSIDAWNNPEARAVSLWRAAHGTENGADDAAEITLMFVNAANDPIEFSFPAGQTRWMQLLDSAQDDGAPQMNPVAGHHKVTVQGNTVMLFGTHAVRF
jgi:isoamylase